MYWNVTMEYSEERGTWNVFADGEWYFEGNFDQCSDVVNILGCPEEYEDAEEVSDSWEIWEAESSRDDWDSDEDCWVDTLRYIA